MAKARRRRERTPPLMSSAGIMRYFEEERTQIKINPKSVLAFGFIIGVLIIILNAFYGLWPGQP
ncbi:MAG: preprotein translocase subunit Sec61beta [Archaeoglobales archaeon]|uniref:Preprotein translocase subunit SecG n=1 Tax=Thermococcus litoralis TaxID=2265 RepID=A0A7C0Y0N2_THELI|nr:MAG: preprotein translocase subunit Sec61beta [Archaeoglobales archaeon]HDD31191.1 preprotein translocase subunit Sec61beta [Thermococcus litoralis]